MSCAKQVYTALATKLLKNKEEENAAKRLEEVKAINPQCSKCKYMSSFPKMPLAWLCIMRIVYWLQGISLLMVSALFPAIEGMPSYAMFQANFPTRMGSGLKKHAPMLQQQSRRVHCWQEGVASCVSVGRSSSNTP